MLLGEGIDEKFHVTEEGILSYCFPTDGCTLTPERRLFETTWAPVTPSFFTKLTGVPCYSRWAKWEIQASKNSRFLGNVELRLEYLRFDVRNLLLGVLPSQSQEDAENVAVPMNIVRYDIPNHGNGVRLLVAAQNRRS